MNLLRGWLFDNIGLKLTALILAVIVYLNVYTDRTTTLLVSFPVDFSDLPDSLSVSGSAPSVVQAEMRGTWKALILLRIREPRLRPPMSGASPGHYSRALVASDLPLPPGSAVTVENLVGPRVIEVDIDRRVRRDVPVAVKLEGPAASLVPARAPVVSPAIVSITGPQKAVMALDTLRVTLARADARRDSVRADLTVSGLPDWCTAEPSVVRVRFALARH